MFTVAGIISFGVISNIVEKGTLKFRATFDKSIRFVAFSRV